MGQKSHCAPEQINISRHRVLLKAYHSLVQMEEIKTIQSDTSDSETETSSARSVYYSLIQETKTLEFTGFAKNLREQEGSSLEDSRAAVIEFLPSGQISQKQFHNSLSLQEYLDTSVTPYPSDGSKQPLRRMIMLEDLARNYIEVLGTRLKIHPSLFAAHWRDPIRTGCAEKGLILGQPSRESFVLQSPQMHYMEIEGQEKDGGGSFYRLDSHVRRNILKGAQESEADLASRFAELWSVVSFWSCEDGDGGWTGKLVLYTFLDYTNHYL